MGIDTVSTIYANNYKNVKDKHGNNLNINSQKYKHKFRN